MHFSIFILLIDSNRISVSTTDLLT